MLFSSGLIAGGAITGVVLTAIAVKGWDHVFNMEKTIGSMGANALVGIVVFAALILFPLYRVATRRE